MLFLFYLYDWLTCGFYYLNKGSQGFDSKRLQFLGPARVSPDQRIKSPKALDPHGPYTLPVCVPIRNTGWNTKACAYSMPTCSVPSLLQKNTSRARSVSVGIYEHALQVWAVLCLYSTRFSNTGLV